MTYRNSHFVEIIAVLDVRISPRNMVRFEKGQKEKIIILSSSKNYVLL